MRSNAPSHLCGYALLLVFVCTQASAQTRIFDGRKIIEVRYEWTDPPLAQEDLDRAQPLKPGAILHGDDLASAIDALYATGRFEDIQVDAEPSGPDGVVLRFLTKPAWFVGHIGIEGKTPVPPNRGQLANTTQLTMGTPFREEDMVAAQSNLKRLLESNGLFDATITPHAERVERTQTVNFTFVLTPGKRARYSAPVVAGVPKLSDAAIIRATGWRVLLIGRWRQVTQEKTRGGVDGLLKRYQKQDRLTAQVKLDSVDYNPATKRVVPHLTINAGPKVRVEAVEAKVSKSRLQRYVPIYEEGSADRDLLVEGARNLRGYFQSQGYYDASVDFRPVQQKPDELTVEYVIARGPRSKLKRVTIQGNQYFKEDSLRERMFLQPSSLQYRYGRYSEAFLHKDEEAIENLYKANGFRDVEATSEVISPFEGKDGQIAVTFTVNEGRQWFVEDLALVGAERFSADELLGQLSSGKGQPFSEVSVAADRNAILTRYYTAGYPAATFEYKSEPADAANRVKLTYTLAEGPQQFIRDVVVTGLKSTRPAVVERRLLVKSGDPLSPTAIIAAQKRLYDLGVFAKVNATVQNASGTENRKFVLYDIEEAQRYSLKLGFGAEIAQFGGTTNNLSSPGGATGFSPRGSMDLSRLNLFGVGQTLSLRGRVSNLEQRAAIEYMIPRFLHRDDQNLTFSLLYAKARDVRTFSSRRQEASMQLSRQLSKSTQALFRFTYRRVSTGDVVIPALLVPQLLQPIRIGILSANFVQDRRDNPTDAHRGMYSTADLGLASNIFGSQRNFARTLGKNASYHKIGKKLVFARQTQIGLIFPYNPPKGISAGDSVPLPERFFGGGSNSHRGFPFNQAGPRDIGVAVNNDTVSTQPTGFPLGGNALLFNTSELRFPLIGDNISGVLFHDAGNVYRTISDISVRSSQRNLQDFNYMVHAAGFGIRYKTPIGPVRLDLAYSINPPKYVGFKGTQAELLLCNPNAVATGVCKGVQQSISHFQFSFSIGQAF